ncbi:MAG: hypothetical protein ACRDNI_08295 [Gaiellaceae bacterium]
MRRLLIAAIAVGTLVQAGVASAGCWATVGLAPPPAGIAPGDTWTARLTVLQHGQTPLPDAKTARPTLTIVNDATGARRTFVASPTRDLTVFSATVAFPSAGSWRYEVFDGFTTWQGQPEPCARTHSFAAVAIGGIPAGGAEPPAPTPPPAPAAATTGDGFPVWPVTAAFLAALAAVATGTILRRRRVDKGAEVAVR